MRVLTVAIAALGVLGAAPPPRHLSFARAGGVVPGTMRLFVSAADGSQERPLLAVSQDDYDAVWAPDGQSIVFTSDRNGSGDLFRVDADGGGLTQLTSDAAYEDQAAFSPSTRVGCIAAPTCPASRPSTASWTSSWRARSPSRCCSAV